MQASALSLDIVSIAHSILVEMNTHFHKLSVHTTMFNAIVRAELLNSREYCHSSQGRLYGGAYRRAQGALAYRQGRTNNGQEERITLYVVDAGLDIPDCMR
jgi:hypothetical protein